MSESFSQGILDFLSETDPFMEQLDGLSLETAAELYDMLDDSARAATLSISQIDPALRVEICDRQDRVLERIADGLPPFEHSGDPIKVYTPAVHNYRRWSNAELMKDKGLAGYMLAKELGGNAVMYFGTSPPDYPYLSDLPGLEMLYDASEYGTEYDYYEHLSKNFPEMDAMILHGMYPQTALYLDAYRKLRPDGKVFCGLDMNSWWMENTTWDSPTVKGFAGRCDVIATSCRPMRDALNINPKVSFPCHWFPNGFFKPADIQITADYEYKENVILTVGRIGTAAKNNEELMVAFAKVSDIVKGWSLRLVGPVEPQFQPFIEHYFSERPDLKDRVHFTGAITAKPELYAEYSKAKVFALTSPQEGGTPNVYAEALFHGCMFVTSNIDAADDITNFGELGATYELGDIGALSSALITICRKANRTGVMKHIPKALDYAAKYYDWSRNAKKLAYMLFR